MLPSFEIRPQYRLSAFELSGFAGCRVPGGPIPQRCLQLLSGSQAFHDRGIFTPSSILVSTGNRRSNLLFGSARNITEPLCWWSKCGTADAQAESEGLFSSQWSQLEAIARRVLISGSAPSAQLDSEPDLFIQAVV